MRVSPIMEEDTHMSIMRNKNEKGMMNRIALKTSSAVSSDSFDSLALSRMPVSLTSLHCSPSEISWKAFSVSPLDFPFAFFAMAEIVGAPIR